MTSWWPARTLKNKKEHVGLVFDRLDKYNAVINSSKCVFGVPSLEFLGHNADLGLYPLLLSTVDAIRDFPPPTSKRQLQRHLGMVNFYHRFLPNCANLMLPLTNMLFGPKGPREPAGDLLAAFERIKAPLADAILLTHPVPEAPLSLMADASTVASGRSKAERRDAGVDFAIRNDIVGRLLCLPQGINYRLISLRLPLLVSQIAAIIRAYPPQMAGPDEAKSKFYDDLHALLASVECGQAVCPW
nr:unnamed protein product [Spirometra erinaceieuropaei]